LRREWFDCGFRIAECGFKKKNLPVFSIRNPKSAFRNRDIRIPQFLLPTARHDLEVVRLAVTQVFDTVLKACGFNSPSEIF
jgi:hypothetical protein